MPFRLYLVDHLVGISVVLVEVNIWWKYRCQGIFDHRNRLGLDSRTTSLLGKSSSTMFVIERVNDVASTRNGVTKVCFSETFRVDG
jgi:hypothetical protein